MAPRDSSPKPKLRPKESLGSKIMSGIKSAGSQIKSDFQHSTGSKPYTGDALKSYNDRSAASKKAHMDFLDRTKDSGPSGIASLKNMGVAATPAADQYAENLRRYEEFMKTQQPQQPAVTPEMRQEALNIFESQQGAGQMPYYMAASQGATSPAFQYAAQNYGTLGGAQRLGPRPMEMMSVAERRQINDMAQGMADQQAAANEYQKGMDMVMRGGGKGGGATMPQGQPMMPTNLPPNFASMLAQRFGGFGGQ